MIASFGTRAGTLNSMVEFASLTSVATASSARSSKASGMMTFCLMKSSVMLALLSSATVRTIHAGIGQSDVKDFPLPGVTFTCAPCAVRYLMVMRNRTEHVNVCNTVRLSTTQSSTIDAMRKCDTSRNILIIITQGSPTGSPRRRCRKAAHPCTCTC